MGKDILEIKNVIKSNELFGYDSKQKGIIIKYDDFIIVKQIVDSFIVKYKEQDRIITHKFDMIGYSKMNYYNTLSLKLNGKKIGTYTTKNS